VAAHLDAGLNGPPGKCQAARRLSSPTAATENRSYFLRPSSSGGTKSRIEIFRITAANSVVEYRMTQI